MRNRSAADINKAWLAGMQAAGPAYTAGTANPRRDPMQAAASPEGMAAYQAGVMASITSGSRERALTNTPLSKYVNGCAKKGAANLSVGAQLAAAKHLQIMGTWAPIYQQASAAAGAIAKIRGNLANSVQRATAAIAVMMNAAAAMKGGASV